MSTVRNRAVHGAEGAFYDLEIAREGCRHGLVAGIEEDVFTAFDKASHALRKAGRNSRAILTLLAREQHERAEKWADSQRCHEPVSL